MRVLLVEDEIFLAQQLQRALADGGYAVDCAAAGARAEFPGQTERYDAVILDLGLPRMDGLTVLRRWREAALSMPVVILTARGSWHENASP
jgi:two-component system, OmpR family, response regulator